MNHTALTSTFHRSMTSDEIARYERDGFIEIESFFPIDELKQIEAEIIRLRQTTNEQDPNHLLQLGLRSELTRSVCEDPRILDLITPVVKPGIAIYSSKLVEKQPFDKAICHWHQDDAYYRKNSESSCRMSAWIPLQDCDEQNGCVWMVPGSHKRGLRECINRGGGSGHCRLSFADGKDEIEGAVPIRAKAGSIVLFHALTWHRSLANHTDQHRRAFIISYQDALALKGNGAQHKVLRQA